MIEIVGLLLVFVYAQEEDFCSTLTEDRCAHEFLCLWDGYDCYKDPIAINYDDNSESSWDAAQSLCPNPVTDPVTEDGCYIEEYEVAENDFVLLVYSTPTGSDYCSVDYYVFGDECKNTTTKCELDTDGGCYDFCTVYPTEQECLCALSSDYDPGCYCDTNPWDTTCYAIQTNAGICEGRTVFGCNAIPFCHWNTSCKPDWKCYYTDINGAGCNTISKSDGGAGCRTKQIDPFNYCTSDTITSTDEKCIKAGANQEKCESEGCEWIIPGISSLFGPFSGWCVDKGYDICTENPSDQQCLCANRYDPGCYCDTNPWDRTCYFNQTSAGICENRTVFGCSAIPFCHWDSSCKPDWKCYYTDINGAGCNTISKSDGGAGCRITQIDPFNYCTSDTITSTDEKCIKAGLNQEKCESEGCEWVPEGSSDVYGDFSGWCTEIGSRASVAHMSFVAMLALLSVMLTFL